MPIDDLRIIRDAKKSKVKDVGYPVDPESIAHTLEDLKPVRLSEYVISHKIPASNLLKES